MSQPVPSDVFAILATHGWLHLPAGAAALPTLVDTLGLALLHETQVVVREGRVLITSADALDFHTDHHRADIIAWTCNVQTSEGGHSVLADALAAWRTTPPADRALLARLDLFEHAVFPGDRETHPFVEEPHGAPRFYCSFWFDTPPDPAIAAAFDRWQAHVRACEVVRLRLAPGDLLAIDNRRILHGRTAITGSQVRHLAHRWFVRHRVGTADGILAASGTHEDRAQRQATVSIPE